MTEKECEAAQACKWYRSSMYKAAYGILGDPGDAEDVTHEVIAEVLQKRPLVENWEPYLRSAARNRAVSVLRRRARYARKLLLCDQMPPLDPVRDHENRLAVDRLIDRVTPFLPARVRRDMDLYLDVHEGHCTEKELAARLGLSHSQVKNRRRTVREGLRDASVAVLLIDECGTGPDRCGELRRVVDRQAESPELLAKIRRHLRKCGDCGRQRHDTYSLLGRILASAGLIVAAAIAYFRMISGKTATAVALSAAVTLTAVIWRPVPRLLEPPPSHPVMPAPRPPAPAPSSPSPLPPSSSSPSPSPSPTPSQPPPGNTKATGRPPAGPDSEAPSPSAPNTTILSTEPDGSRDDAAPIVSDASIEHRRVTTSSACGPTTTAARATVAAPGGVSSVTIHLRGDGVDLTTPMTNTDGPTWQARLGPFAEHPGRRFGVVVEAVGRNGSRSESHIGTICVSPCHATRGNR